MKGRSLLLLLPLVCALLESGICQTKSFTRSPEKVPNLTVDMANEPRAKQLLSNREVRAYRIDLEPGAQTGVDRHEHDFLVISLGDNQFEFVGAQNAFAMAMMDGEVQVLKGHWAHRIVNRSQKALHLVEVEIEKEINPENAICGLGGKSCVGAKFASKDDTNYVESRLFETASVRLGKVEIAPGKGMPEHGHPSNHLMIALNDQQVVNAVVAGNIVELQAHAGDAAWIEGGIVHRIMNRGTQPARFLTIECK